jgi:hypothetical protein
MFRFRRPEPEDVEGCARVDANLVQLKQRDPDAARIFTTTSSDCLRGRRRSDKFVAQLQEYAALKHTQGRMDLYNDLFHDTSDE